MATFLKISLTCNYRIFVLQSGEFQVETMKSRPSPHCNPASLQEKVTEERVQRLKQRFMSAYDITADGKLQIQEVFHKPCRVF